MEQMVTLKNDYYQVLRMEDILRISQGSMMINSFVTLFSIHLDNKLNRCSYNDRFLGTSPVIPLKYWHGHDRECDIFSPQDLPF